MSYHLYSTEGFILKSVPFSESNKIFYIFTEQLGMVVAVAQGVRELKSKLRFSLQEFGYGDIELIRGKDMWRITNAEEKDNYYYRIDDSASKKTLARVFFLLRRLVSGEEKNLELYHTIKQCAQFLMNSRLDKNELKNLEIIMSLKILHCLGYGSSLQELEPVIYGNVNASLIGDFQQFQTRGVREVNRALRETHL